MALTLQVKTSSGVKTISGIVKLSAGTGGLQLSGNQSANKITVAEYRQSYADWYNTQIANKQLAMEKGGISATSSYSSEDPSTQPGFVYNFTVGKDKYIYGESTRPYLATIQSCSPDNRGNIQILPGKTVDVSESDGNIFLSKLLTGIVTDPGTIYREINVFLWYLYHALNVQVYRLHLFDPARTGYPAFTKSHFMGTIPSYQALVAKWNYLVWKRSFLAKVNESGETLNFSLGYSGVSCTATTVAISAKLLLLDNKEAFDETIKFFTLYSQGVNTSLETSPLYSIKKWATASEPPAGDNTEVQGHGTDDWAGNTTWQMMTVEISPITLSQGEYYNAAFSLAVALNEQTTYFYQSIGNDRFSLQLVITWTITDSSGTHSYSRTTDNLHIRTILLHSEEPEDVDN